MPNEVQRLQQVIDVIRQLGQQAGIARPELAQLETVLNSLTRRTRVPTGSKSVAGGLGFLGAQPSAPGQGSLRFPSKQTIVNLSDYLTQLNRLGGVYRATALSASYMLQQINKINVSSNRMGVGLGQRAPLPSGANAIEASLTGRGQDITGLFGSIPEQIRVASSLSDALDLIRNKYGQVGAELGNIKAELDITNKAWTVQAQILKDTGQGLKLLTTEQVRLGAMTSKELPASLLEADLQKRLGGAGSQQYTKFIQNLKEMGLGMEHLNNVQVDAINGIARFSFATKDASGAMRSANFHIDKWGRLLGDTGTRFRSFSSMITRNIDKVLEWGIAVGLVFGAFRKFQEMFSFMVEIEAILARMAVVTGQTTGEMGMFFEAAAVTAREAGVDITDALDAAVSAMQSIPSDDAERAAKAFDLLGDAAVLARLGDIEMTKATDMLVSALKQLDMELTDSDTLLNKWVAVTKEANVNLLNFSDGFAGIAGDAKAAGLSVDELNALIATMASVTTITERQTTNAVRAMFGEIKKENVQEQLRSYGVIVNDTNGVLRNRFEILQDISELYRAGGLGATPGENEIGLQQLASLIGGGGVRRQAQMVSVIKELSNAPRLVIASAGATNEALIAMGLTSDTLETSVTNLGNAFKELAESLGTEGGLLGILTGIVKGLTSLVDLVKDLTGVLGPATSAIVAMGIAGAVNRKTGLGAILGARIAGQQVAAVPPGTTITGQAAAGPSLGARAFGLAGRAAPGLIAGATHIAQAITGDMGWEEAGGRTAGAIAGSLIGSLGGPAGSFIGSIIGDAIIGSAITGADRLKEVLELDIQDLSSMELRNLEAEIIKKSTMPGLMGVEFFEGGEELPGTLGQMQQQLQAVRAEMAVRAAQTTEAARGEETFNIGVQRRIQLTKAYGMSLEAVLDIRRRELPFEFLEGEITSIREYESAVEQLDVVMRGMPTLFMAFEEAITLTGGEVDNLAKEYTSMGSDMAQASPQILDFLMEQAQLFLGVRDAGLEATGAGEEYLDMMARAREIITRQDVDPFPSIRDFGKLDPGELEEIMAEAARLQGQAVSQLGISDEQLAQIDEWVFSWEEADRRIYDTKDGMDQQFINMAIERRKRLQEEEEGTFNIRRLQDVDPSQQGQIAASNRYWIEYISRLKGISAQEYLQDEGEQFNLLLGPNNTLQQIYSTNEAMLFTLQDILDTEEKQLEGMWNIPAGATFWVPITSLFYQKGQGGGFPELPELIPPTKETAANTASIDMKMSSLADILQNLDIDISMLTAGDLDNLMEATKQYPIEIQELLKGQALREFGASALASFEREVLGITPDKLLNFLTTERVPQPTALPAVPPQYLLGGGELPNIEVNVEVPNIEGSFNIFSTVQLDGRVVYSYVQRIVAKALETTIRSSRRSTINPGPR